MKRFSPTIVLLFFYVVSLFGQSDNLIKELENKHKTLQREITQTEKLLDNTKKDVSSQLQNLNILTGQIETRKQYISTINTDISTIESELKALNNQLRNLQKDLTIKKKNYEASVQYLYQNKTIEEKLMFIFSADDLQKTYRRLRYVREYATYQRLQGEEIMQRRAQIKKKTAELANTKSAKDSLLSTREQEKTKLEQEEKKKRSLVTDLQKKQKNLQSEINKKKREASRLNTQIDRLIFEEMERVRKRAEDETRKTKRTSKGKNDMDRVDRSISEQFASQRGKLPMPITGSSIIVSQYGEYNVQGLKNVKLNNKGIDIQGQPGASARAVFDGKVAAVFSLNGLLNVLIRHGNYITVYCNLSSTSVKQGEDVEAEQIIGKVFSDPANNKLTLLHFQMHVEKEKLNPELWLKRW
jgi:septal ring factor EnvC (AmiA/AmiB activator)